MIRSGFHDAHPGPRKTYDPCSCTRDHKRRMQAGKWERERESDGVSPSSVFVSVVGTCFFRILFAPRLFLGGGPLAFGLLSGGCDVLKTVAWCTPLY
eukprot:scaffold27601_cov69-Cyclotella_meneghiniana.AAC.3